jgi:tRNA G26 N,N-dimethylase Trm1
MKDNIWKLIHEIGDIEEKFDKLFEEFSDIFNDFESFFKDIENSVEESSGKCPNCGFKYEVKVTCG